MLIHEDRLLPADPATRAVARRLYGEVRDLPIVSPHGHTDPRWYAEDAPFPDPARLFVVPGPLHLPHALQPGRAARGARHPRARTAARSRPTRARSGAASPRTITCSAARRRGCGSTRPSPSCSASTVRLSAETADDYFDRISECARPAGVPAARAVRALQDRGDRHDRKPARPARAPHGDPANPAGTGASSPPTGPTRWSIPSSRASATTSRRSANITRVRHLRPGTAISKRTGSAAPIFKQHGATSTDHGHPTGADRGSAAGRCRAAVRQDRRGRVQPRATPSCSARRC